MTTKKQLTFGILIAFAAVLSLGITTTTTYAQQGKACPEGFQLNKGTCQAEPELSCDSYGVPPHRIQLVNGECERLWNNGPLCVEPGTYYEIFEDRCEIAGTNDPSPNQEMSCDYLEEVGATLQEFEGYWQCIWYETLGPATQECDVGTLNEASGLCEVKPGNRNGNRA